jgi:hypothetical protein
LIGKRLQRRLTSCFYRLTKTVLRRPLEPARKTFLTVMTRLLPITIKTAPPLKKVLTLRKRFRLLPRGYAKFASGWVNSYLSIERVRASGQFLQLVY